jgi:hypothetical protein
MNDDTLCGECGQPLDVWQRLDEAVADAKRLHAALEEAVLGGVEVAAKVRDANQAERRRLEAEIERLRETLTEIASYHEHGRHSCRPEGHGMNDERIAADDLRAGDRLVRLEAGLWSHDLNGEVRAVEPFGNHGRRVLTTGPLGAFYVGPNEHVIVRRDTA